MPTKLHLSTQGELFSPPAALWLIDRWPDRFLRCCKEANTRSPILNRGAVSVRWFNAAVKSAYDRAG
jgi:hypothetical protein